MLSLRLLIPTKDTVTLRKPKPFLSQCTLTQTVPFPSVPPPKLNRVRTHVALNDNFAFAGDLPESLLLELMPRHVAVIMDGNVRWARRRGLPAASGHAAGVRPLRELTGLCCDWGIEVLTVFAFSTENWNRSKVEVNFLMSLFERTIESELDNMMRHGIRLSTIGDASKLPHSLQKVIDDAKETTKPNSRLQLIVALNYGAKSDLVQACSSIAHKVKDGLVKLQDINETMIEQELETKCTEYPYPDLLIRTSGELRVSNFFLWQLAYTELFFAQALWPDFGKAQFIEALTSFQQRKRRYGGRDIEGINPKIVS